MNQEQTSSSEGSENLASLQVLNLPSSGDVLPPLANPSGTLRIEDRLARTGWAMRVFKAATRALLCAKDERHLIKEICERMVTEGGYCLAWFGFADPDGECTVRPVAWAGLEQGYLEQLQQSRDENELGHGASAPALQTETPVVIRDIRKHSGIAGWGMEAVKRGYAACAALPLRVENKTPAVLMVYAAEPGSFDAAEMELLADVSHLLSYGIDARRMRLARERAEQFMAAFTELDSRLNGAATPQTAARVIAEIAGHLFGWDTYKLDLHDARRGLSQPVLKMQLTDGRRQEIPLTTGSETLTPLMRRVIDNGPELHRPKHGEIEHEGSNAASAPSVSMTVPLRHGKNVIGGLSVQSYSPDAYHEEDLAAFQTLADHCAGAMERISGQEALREVEERFRQLAENMDEVFWLMDLEQQQMLYVSPAYERIWRQSCERLYAASRNWFDAIHPDDRDRVSQAFLVRQGQADFEQEYRIVCPDGSLRWIRCRTFPIQDAEGRVFRVGGIARDITESKQAEWEIQHQASFARFNPNPVLELSASGEINYFNEAAGEMARLLGREHPAQILPPTTSGIVQECLTTGRARFRLETQAGQRTISWSFFPIKLTNVVHCYAGDVTERKRDDDQLREQASLLDKARDAIIVRGLDHRITYWNKSAERLYGWTAQEAIGQSAAELLYKGTAAFQQACQRFLQNGEWAGELQQAGKDGKNLIIESRWTLVRNVSGEPKAVLAIDTDITERKKLEAQFLRVQRMESIGTLSSGIAHDLNNVLAPILMSVPLLSQFVTDQEGHALLAMVESTAQRGADLVKQVLSFARGVEGERVTVHPANLLRDIQKIISETFPKNINASFPPARNLWSVTGDPTQLHQVFMNLCLNARDAMPDGGKLTITSQNIILDEVYADMNPESKPGAYVMVKVADTGSGIPPAIRDKIFEPFFTSKEIGRGTGLGLSTALAIVRSHGGFINVYSEPGRGAQFKIYLPSNTTSDAVETASREETQLPTGHGELVLVVDDEEGIRTVAQRTLERFGYRVLLAAHGAQAVALYAQHRDEIAIVLTDMAMPVMDGPSTVTALRAINPNLRIIGSSGLASGSAFAGAAGAGVQHFIPKPYTAETMLKVLAHVLQEPS
jgi:PAS domain S-box-containing protein